MSARKAGPRAPIDAARGRAASPAFTLGAAWALAIVALLVVLFFHEVVIGGKTFVSPDATAPAGFGRIGEQSLYHDKVYPMWNPFVFLGMPSFGSGTYNPLIYPPDWPVAILQKLLPLPDLTWMLIYYVLAGFATFLLARAWGARPEGALLAGAAFVFAPNLVAVGSHGHGSQLVDSAYLPLMLWLATRWMRGGGLSSLALLGLAGGFQMLRGHAQICFYTWLAVALYTVIEWAMSLRRRDAIGATTLRAVSVMGAAVLAFGLAGFYNLPLKDYAPYSIRGSGEGGGVSLDYATQWSMAPYELPATVVPAWVGFGGQTYWGGMPFTDYPNAFVGMVTIALAVLALAGGGGAPRVFALALAAMSLLVSFGRYFPVYGLLYDHLPLFNRFRVPVMIILLFQLATALGLAWGWSAALEHGGDPAREKRVGRLLGIGAVVLALGLLAGSIGRSALEGSYVVMAVARGSAHGQPYPQELARMAFGAFADDLVRASLIGLLALGLAWLSLRRKIPAAAASVGVLVLLLIELWPVSGRVMLPTLGDPVQRDQALERDDVVEFLQSQGGAGDYRILPFQEFQSNRYAGFAIASVGGYHAAKPRIAQDLIETQFTERFRAGMLPPLDWLRLLNIRFIVLPQPIEPAPPGWRLVHQGSQAVYENPDALPRATVVGHVAVVTPERAILDSVAAGTRDVAAWAYLPAAPSAPLGDVQGATAKVTEYQLNHVVVDVDTPGPGLLRLADLWYPDWAARVDGRPADVLRADYLLRAVPVPAGRHRVEFRFESRAMRRGLTLSIASLVVVLVLFGVDLALRRRRSNPQAA